MIGTPHQMLFGWGTQHMWRRREIHSVQVRKPGEKRPHTRPILRQEYNIKKNPKGIGWEGID